MDTVGRESLIEQLRVTRQSFVAAASGMTEAQGKFKPAPDRWSVEECAEHLALVERGILKRISEESTASDPVVRPERQEELRQAAGSRANKRQAPDRVSPTGQFGSLAKALEQFASNREKTIAYVGSCPEDLHARTVTHPVFGSMTSHEYLIFMANHTLRHLDQVREIQASPGFPS
ncbi:MAG TPA: DinB family protein [Terriglobia bacterium]|nr:DinB family protein [Terriglobia bacterium]